jgi:hypothetical protein
MVKLLFHPRLPPAWASAISWFPHRFWCLPNRFFFHWQAESRCICTFAHILRQYHPHGDIQWRYLLYIAQFISEFALILGPSATMSNPSDTSASGSSTIHENILVAFFPRRVAYQHVLLLHQIFIFASIAVSRVAPVLFPPTIEEVEGLGMDPRLVQGVLEKITELSQNIDRESPFIFI